MSGCKSAEIGTSAAVGSRKCADLVSLEGNRLVDSLGVCMALRSCGTYGQSLVANFVPCLPAFLSLPGSWTAPVCHEGCRNTTLRVDEDV